MRCGVRDCDSVGYVGLYVFEFELAQHLQIDGWLVGYVGAVCQP